MTDSVEQSHGTDNPSNSALSGFERAANTACSWLQHWHESNLTVFPGISYVTSSSSELSNLLCRLAYHNYIIWHYEDTARCDDYAKVAFAKKRIDPNNQKRNDTIEKIDEIFVSQQEGKGPYNSETIGSIIDRITINELKILHIQEFPEQAAQRLPVLEKQKEILIRCGSELLRDMLLGNRQIVNFKQLKMYNDPKTNPLFGKKDA